MGILQSVMRYASSESEADEQLNNDRSNPNNTLASPHQFHNGNYLTIAVPNFRNSSSLAHTTVNTSSPEFTQITPHNVSRRENQREEAIRCTLAIAAALDAAEGRGESQREEAAVTIKRNVSRRRRRRAVVTIKHYSSRHQILLVGEGDFSFAACLVAAFGWATNMVATSLDSEEMLMRKHPTAAEKLVLLRDKGCTVIHNVDARTMSIHHLLCHIRFDRIVYNFPHAGFISSEQSPLQIMLHQNVVRGFLRNAYEMVKEKGEVHITHKTKYPYSEWKVEELGKEAGFVLIEKAGFCIWEYPGYINKRGDGKRSNQTFPIGDCCTYKFAKI